MYQYSCGGRAMAVYRLMRCALRAPGRPHCNDLLALNRLRYSTLGGRTDHGDDGPSTSDSAEPGHEQRTQQQIVKKVLRDCHVAEAAAKHFFEGQRLVQGRRIDLEHFRAQEAQQVQALEALLPKYRARPSPLLGPLAVTSMAVGAIASVAPRSMGLAVAGALQDALTEHHNDRLRELQETGVALQVEDVRDVVKGLRDLERAPEGAPAPPDVVTLSQMERLEDVGAEGLVGAAVKAGTRLALDLASKL